MTEFTTMTEADNTSFSTLSYHSRLTTIENLDVHKLSTLVCKFNDRTFGIDHPVVLLNIPTSNVQANAMGSNRNDTHRLVVIGLVLNSLRESIRGHQLAIITPYRNQQFWYRCDLLNAARRNPTIRDKIIAVFTTTIDGFQGGEREVCIVDLTCSDRIEVYWRERNI
jgi:AAA domain